MIKFGTELTKITVICNCTSYRTQWEVLSKISHPFSCIKYPLIPPTQASEKIPQLLEELSSSEGLQALVIDNPTSLLAVALILANSSLEHKREDILCFPQGTLQVFELWNSEVVKISKDDGTIPLSSFDTANQPLIAEWLQLQHANQETTPQVEEHLQICETADASEHKTLDQIILERKSSYVQQKADSADHAGGQE